MDARGGESNTQHILLHRDVIGGRDAVQITHVADEKEKEVAIKKRRREWNESTSTGNRHFMASVDTSCLMLTARLLSRT